MRKPETITTRVSSRVRRLVEVAAEQESITLSTYTAQAVEDAARRTLLLDPEDSRGPVDRSLDRA